MFNFDSKKDFFWTWYNVTMGTDCSFSTDLKLMTQTEMDMNSCIDSCLNKDCTHFTWLNSKQACTLYLDKTGLINETEAFFEPDFTCGIIRRKATQKNESL